jgi:hypothetical protein
LLSFTGAEEAFPFDREIKPPIAARIAPAIASIRIYEGRKAAERHFSGGAGDSVREQHADAVDRSHDEPPDRRRARVGMLETGEDRAKRD